MELFLFKVVPPVVPVSRTVSSTSRRCSSAPTLTPPPSPLAAALGSTHTLSARPAPHCPPSAASSPWLTTPLCSLWLKLQLRDGGGASHTLLRLAPARRDLLDPSTATSLVPVSPCRAVQVLVLPLCLVKLPLRSLDRCSSPSSGHHLRLLPQHHVPSASGRTQGRPSRPS